VGLITLIMANIGTTITPWQIFFQQSAVVDKGMDVRDIKMGKIDTFAGSMLTCIVAAFIIIATAGVFYYHPGGKIVVESAAQTAAMMPEVMPAGTHWGQWARLLFAVGLFEHIVGAGRGVRLGALAKQERARSAVVLRGVRGDVVVGRRGIAGGCHKSSGHDYDFRAGGCGDAVARGAVLPDPDPERQTGDGRTREHALAEHRQLVNRRFCGDDLDIIRSIDYFPRVVWWQILERAL
jgi:hypothetical protein